MLNDRPGLKRKPPTIVIKRAYDEPSPDDGYRVLVDRVWPRGRSRETLALAQWLREIAPSDALRKWFGHDPQRWEEFQQRYLAELQTDEQLARMRSLLADAAGQPITLVYGAKDPEHNQALVLRDALLRLRQG